MHTVPMSSALDLAKQRHNEIRTALRFFLNSWHKHRQNTSIAEPRAVLDEFLRFKAFTSSLQQHYSPLEAPKESYSKRGRDRS